MTDDKSFFFATYSFYRPHDRAATAYTGELVNHLTGQVFTPPSLTKQEFANECDINNILADYKMTGQIRHINEKAAQGMYADLPVAQDFQEALNLVMDAERSFASLPSHVRSRFGNNPEQFLAFLQDPANQDEAIKLGLATDNRPPPEVPPTLSTGPENGPPTPITGV